MTHLPDPSDVGPLYLSGPMSGIPGHNFPTFARFRNALRYAGYTVLCPAESSVRIGPDAPRKEYLRWDLSAVMLCTGIVQLPGWRNSIGAITEAIVGVELDLQFWEVNLIDGGGSVGEFVGVMRQVHRSISVQAMSNYSDQSRIEVVR